MADATPSPNKSALIVVAPEAESLVGDFRLRFDPTAALGVPAHITLLYPFRSADALTPAIDQVLAETFSRFEAFPFCLRSTATFPSVLYLAPDSDERFRMMTEALVQRFPDCPPYEGKFSDIVPHLTIADVETPKLQPVIEEFKAASAGKLPICGFVNEVWLYVQEAGRWKPLRSFFLDNRARPNR